MAGQAADERNRNMAVIRAHFVALDQADADGFANTHHMDGRNHAPGPFDLSEWPAEGKPFGPDQARETFVWMRVGSPDLRVEIEELIADGDQVVAWIRMTGTQSGSRGPVPATGRKVDVRHAHRFRMREGLIVEHWAVRDDLRAMIQAGVVTPPDPPSTE